MFLILFITGIMVIPIILDAKKNRDNSIIKRAWADIKMYKKEFLIKNSCTK